MVGGGGASRGADLFHDELFFFKSSILKSLRCEAYTTYMLFSSFNKKENKKLIEWKNNKRPMIFKSCFLTHYWKQNPGRTLQAHWRHERLSTHSNTSKHKTYTHINTNTHSTQTHNNNPPQSALTALWVITVLSLECFVFRFACSVSKANNHSLFTLWAIAPTSLSLFFRPPLQWGKLHTGVTALRGKERGTGNLAGCW